jgi:uncharacterized membrane protein
MERKEERFIEIDLLRGIAIALMVCFHLLWDLDYYGLNPLDKHIYWYSQICPVVFFSLVGMCLVLSARNKTTKQIVQRGAIILAIGCIISLISMLIIPDKPVSFGVLHCIGLSIIIGAFFMKMRTKTLICIAVPIMGLGAFVNNWHMSAPNIIQLVIGIHQADLSKFTVDYFPMLPWFGIVLFGMALCGVMYKDGKRQFPFPDLSRFVPVQMISWLGKHSLTIYLAHQPIIAGTLIYVVPYVMPIVTKYI